MSDDLVDIFKFANLKESDTAITEETDANPDLENTIDYHDIMTEEYELNDTRVAMIGNVDSGKSTLIGVLTNATLDDGRGGKPNLIDALHS
jgi:polynucleotide 5'-kinase involved in rRNA processing